jgi:hypothetical protein
MVPEDAEDVQAGCEARVSSAHRGSALSACERETTSPIFYRLFEVGWGGLCSKSRGEKEAHCTNGVVRASALHLVLNVSLVVSYLCNHAAKET